MTAIWCDDTIRSSFSCAHESEADKIGLILAIAGYNPEESIVFGHECLRHPAEMRHQI
jgi:hypothetical protein